MAGSDGLILLRKPAGVTSFVTLGAVKKKLGIKKVGHTGTLDKFAEGLLVVLTGKYTRLAPFVSNMDKTYECVFEFGRETTTLDPEGEVISESSPPDNETLVAAVKKFIGHIIQRPPEFSAVHIEGKRAYERALKGEKVQMPERPVTIYAFDIREYNPPYLSCSISCSKGTYIRSIARDLGKACSSCAYVKELKRTQVGPFRIEDAAIPEELDPAVSLINTRDFLEKIIPGNSATVKDAYYNSLRMGKPLKDEFFDEGLLFSEKKDEKQELPIMIFTHGGELAAVIEKNENGYAYRFVCA